MDAHRLSSYRIIRRASLPPTASVRCASPMDKQEAQSPGPAASAAPCPLPEGERLAAMMLRLSQDSDSRVTRLAASAAYNTTVHLKEAGGGAAAWVRRWWRALVGEVLATALLVLFGVASLLPHLSGDKLVPAPLEHPALAFGFIVLANVETFGPISGAHMNPSVTLAALLFGKLPLAVAGGYLVAQTVGAMLGFGAVAALAPAPVLVGAAGCTLPAAGVSPYAAAGVEALLTGLLALVCCAVWSAHNDANPDRTVSIKFGLTIAGLVYAGGELTGTSLNPARSLAPALFQNVWKHHWVYWVGPLGGTAVATLLYRFVLAAPAPATPAPRAEELPLHDKADR